MRNVGIICEYNPLHGGHKYMISKLRAMGAEKIICLMSGNAVQRGDFSVLPKNIRAEAAISAGADAVLELPYPYSSGSAEFFASAGVDILARLGVDTIAFGSESGNITKLTELAKKAIDFLPSGNKNVGIAEDYFASLGDVGSNEILGIEYIKAGKKYAPGMKFVTIKREGAGYHDEENRGSYPSATEIRKAISEGNLDKYSEGQLPAESRRAILSCDPVFLNNIESAVLAFWRMCDTSIVSGYAECGGGVAQRLASAAKNAVSLEKMMSLAATKRYTDAKLRRAVLFGMTGVTLDDLKADASYVNLLASNSAGIEFVADVHDIAVVPKPSKIPNGERSARQFELGERFDALYTLAMGEDSGFFLRKSPKIL